MPSECHETRRYMGNSFYVITAVLRDRENDKTAFSDLETLISKKTMRVLKLSDLPTSMEDNELRSFLDIYAELFFMVELGYGSRAIAPINKGEVVRYASKDLISKNFPRSYKDLLSRPLWLEKDGEEYKKARWANSFYKKLLGKRK